MVIDKFLMKLFILPSSSLFVSHSYKWAVVGKGPWWCCSQRLGMGFTPGHEKPLQFKASFPGFFEELSSPSCLRHL